MFDEAKVSRLTFAPVSKPAVYTPPGEGSEPVETRVVLDLAVNVFDENGMLIARSDTADFLLEDVQPERGGRLTVSGFDGEWDVRDRNKDDGYVRKMILSKRRP